MCGAMDDFFNDRYGATTIAGTLSLVRFVGDPGETLIGATARNIVTRLYARNRSRGGVRIPPPTWGIDRQIRL